MFCRFCGTQLNDNAVFCNNCGNRIKSSNKNNVIDYTTLSLGGEIKKSKVLYIIPLVYLVWAIMRHFLFRTSAIVGNMTYMEIVSVANIIIQGFFWGSLAYAAIKRTIRFTMVFMIPYLLFAVGYPFLFNSFKYITTSLSSFIDYAGGIIMPFAILGMLRVFKALMNNIKSKWPLGIVSVLVTIILFSVYIIAIYWMSYAESGMSFYLPIQMLLFYAAGIIVSNVLMQIIYRAR